MDVNDVILVGNLEAPLRYAYNEGKKRIFFGYLLVERLSGTVDHIPITIEEKHVSSHMTSNNVKVRGYIIGKTRNDKYNFSVRIYQWDIPKEDSNEKTNRALMSGKICSDCIVKECKGNKILYNVLIASTINENIKSYVPAFAWNNLGEYISKLKQGKRIFVDARIQSRRFIKTAADGTNEEKEVYELLIVKLRKKK